MKHGSTSLYLDDLCEVAGPGNVVLWTPGAGFRVMSEEATRAAPELEKIPEPKFEEPPPPPSAPRPVIASEAKPYCMASIYQKGDTIAHPKFGEGKVKHTERDRIVVQFGKGVGDRVLIHGRRSA